MKELTAERREYRNKRIQEFLLKAEVKGKIPKSFYDRLFYEMTFRAWKLFAEMHTIYERSFFPLLEVESQSANMKRCASMMLLRAAPLGWIEKSQELIHKLNANVNYQDKNGNTPLHRAIDNKRLKMVEMLLQNGADANKPNKFSLSPLLNACRNGFANAIPVFSKYNVDFNKKITYRQWNKFCMGYKSYPVFPLTLAILSGQTAVVAELLKHGANLDVSYFGKMTLRTAILKDREIKLGIFTPEIHIAVSPYLQKKHREIYISPFMDKQKTRG